MERNGAEPDNIINRGANLKDLIVRPITPGEENEWNILMAKHHYLGFHCLSGRRLKYVALLNGRWLLTARRLSGSFGADGKPVHLVSAFPQHEKIVVGQRQADKKSNEITAFKPLLEPLDMEGGVVTADAMHTQAEHARFIVEDKKADFVFPVKQNQGNLFETIRNTKDEDFSPSIQNTGKVARTN